MHGQPTQVPPNWKTHPLTIIVLLLVGPVALYSVYRHSLSLGIQARIDSIHHARFPATCAELDKWYPQPPAGENAADVFMQAFAHYATWTNRDVQFSTPIDAGDRDKFSIPPKSKRDLLPIVGTAKLPPRVEPLTAEMQKLVAEYLSDNAESLRLLHEASLMKSCRYPIDLTKGPNTLLPHLSSLRQGERLLALEAIRYTEEQHPQTAVESIVAALGFSRSLNQEPVIISYLVHVACQEIALESLERILNRIPLTDTQLVKLATAIQESENPQALTRALIGDRCTDVGIFQDLRTGKTPLKEMYGMWGENPFWSHFLALAYTGMGVLEVDERNYLDILERDVKATQLQPPESIAASHEAYDPVEQLSRWCVLTPMLLPPIAGMVNKAAQCDANIRDAQTALAIERYRLANDRLPNQLGDLVPTFLPSVPSDPFDGKPHRYKRLAKGYVVYSVGDDREDNGGAEKDSKGVSYAPGTDITFAVER